MTGRPILSRAQMTAAEQAAVERGVSIETLMERAGLAAAGVIRDRFAPCAAVVWCGPGNNGGDGYVTARLLRRWGWPVRVEALAPPATPAAVAAAKRWRGETTPLGEPGEADLYIDALFGAGLNRPLGGPALAAARFSLCRPERVVAIDLPSGVSDDLARPLGEAVGAGLTIAFHRRRRVHVLLAGREACGEVVLTDIGLTDAAGQDLWENTPELWAGHIPWPKPSVHKHHRGRLVVISGQAWRTGAARLAARAGLRVGAGVVTLMSPREALPINAAHLEAVMLAPFDVPGDLEAAAEMAEAAIIGPAAGADATTMANLLALARTGAALVVDADALTAFRSDPSELFHALDRDDVLTPHMGEFERLFPGLIKKAPDKITAVRQAAAKAGAIILLKGFDTVVASPDGRAAVSCNGSPWLASAGTGDVLAGLVGGLLAQGMESFEAACAGAWIHAEAAQAFGPGLIAEDLPDLTPGVLKRLYSTA